jgi:hypothetical protein
VTPIEMRSNWLSEIIEEKRQTGDRPIPLFERKAERDAIVMAIRAHPNGQLLAAIKDLDDVIWESLGVARHQEQEAKENPHIEMPSAAIQASLFILNVHRTRRD